MYSPTAAPCSSSAQASGLKEFAHSTQRRCASNPFSQTAFCKQNLCLSRIHALFRIHLRFLFSFPFLAVLSVLIQRQMADVLVIWGRVDYDGDSSAVQDQLKNVQQTQATRRAICLCVCVCVRACMRACVCEGVSVLLSDPVTW